jgi:hypothetical protein
MMDDGELLVVVVRCVVPPGPAWDHKRGIKKVSNIL